MSDIIKVVAFVGKMKSGKTTAADYLVRNGYMRLRFAGPLKMMLRFGLGVPYKYVDGDSKDEPCEQLCGRTARHAMITLGTEWGRDMIHPDLWVKAMERELLTHIGHGGRNFVIDDVRFVNEGDWIWELKYTKDIVIDPCLIRVVRDIDGPIIDHVSETEQEKIKTYWTIINEATVDELHNGIDQALDMFYK